LVYLRLKPFYLFLSFSFETKGVKQLHGLKAVEDTLIGSASFLDSIENVRMIGTQPPDDIVQFLAVYDRIDDFDWTGGAVSVEKRDSVAGI
jgi:hypothetical protein